VSNNLHRLGGGIMKRERAAWAAPCSLASCDEPAAGVIDTLYGPRGLCERHIPGAEERGFTVRREPLT
jgi:hypothetical protein